MNCEQLSFSSITPSRWKAICDLVKEKTGIVITSDDSEDGAHGYRLKWTYTAASNTLLVRCLEAPFPASHFPASINHAITDWVSKTS